MSVGFDGALAQNAKNSQRRILEHVDGGHVALLADGKVASRRMHGNGAHGSAAHRLQVALLFGAHVEQHGEIAGAEDERLFVEYVQVGALLAVVAERMTFSNTTTNKQN